MILILVEVEIKLTLDNVITLTDIVINKSRTKCQLQFNFNLIFAVLRAAFTMSHIATLLLDTTTNTTQQLRQCEVVVIFAYHVKAAAVVVGPTFLPSSFIFNAFPFSDRAQRRLQAIKIFKSLLRIHNGYCE